MKMKIQTTLKSIIDVEAITESDFSYDEKIWFSKIFKIVEELFLGRAINLIAEKPRKTSIIYELSENYVFIKSSKILIAEIYVESALVLKQIIEDEGFKLGTMRILISEKTKITNNYFDYFNYPNIKGDEILAYMSADSMIFTIINSPLTNMQVDEKLTTSPKK